jgi:hypothetical protein
MADNAYVTTWDFKDKHVDTSITKENFLSSARCLIYAAPTRKDNPNAAPANETFKRIGVIQGWNWGENRQIELIFELGSDIPYLVPGRTTGQISLSRIMLFGKDLTNMIYDMSGSDTAQAFDETKPETFIKSIREINTPFDLMFAAFNNNENSSVVYSRVFTGCWLQSKNESISAGQILIAENVNIMYESVVSVQIPAKTSTTTTPPTP